MICHITNHLSKSNLQPLQLAKGHVVLLYQIQQWTIFSLLVSKQWPFGTPNWVGKPIRNGIGLIVTSKVWWIYFDMSFFSLLESSTLLWCANTTSMCDWNMCAFLNIYHLNFFKIEMDIDVQILCQFLWWTIWLKEWSTRLDPCFLVAIMAKQMCSRCISRWKKYISTCELVKFVVGNTLINIEI